LNRQERQAHQASDENSSFAVLVILVVKIFMKPQRLFWILLALLFTLDQAAKEIVQQSLPRYGSTEILGSFFRLTYVQNPGVAFGFLGQHREILLVMVPLLLAFGLWSTRDLDWRGSREVNVIAALILAGALGNWVDRLRYGYVVDFLDLYLAPWDWHVFNVFNGADAFISLAATWVVLRQLKLIKK
jgi:signal peptidase II